MPELPDITIYIRGLEARTVARETLRYWIDREANYCARCQTGGRLLADRSLSRLLKQDWPRTLDELEARRTRR